MLEGWKTDAKLIYALGEQGLQDFHVHSLAVASAFG
jgi:hypothetical protein